VGFYGPAGTVYFRHALRALLCSRKKVWDIFDRIFEAFWYGRELDQEESSEIPVTGSPGNTRRGRSLFADAPGSVGQKKAEETKIGAGAVSIERLTRMDFAEVAAGDLAELEQLAERLLRRLSFRLSRKVRPADLKGRLDLRRTMRTAVARGGELISLKHRRRRTQAARLVILLDTSDSMNPYSLFLFRFAFALNRYFRDLACFVFSTRLADVTMALKTKTLPDAMKRVSALAPCWSGGTKIAGALREFNLGYGRRTRAAQTSMLILSDGWDTDEPEALVAELIALKQRAKKLIWLNPLLGLEGYEPVTRSMNAALPYIDVFAPAHNLQSLLELESYV
jgi:uncharacterized protein with von Willebrand factor type A (vWA) domain